MSWFSPHSTPLLDGGDESDTDACVPCPALVHALSSPPLADTQACRLWSWSSPCCCPALTDALSRRLALGRTGGSAYEYEDPAHSGLGAAGGGAEAPASHLRRSLSGGLPDRTSLSSTGRPLSPPAGGTGPLARQASGAAGAMVTPLTPKRVPDDVDPVAAAIMDAARAPPRTPLRTPSPYGRGLTPGGSDLAWREPPAGT